MLELRDDDVIRAWLNNETIQYLSNGEWRDYNPSHFRDFRNDNDASPFQRFQEWRVKPIEVPVVQEATMTETTKNVIRAWLFGESIQFAEGDSEWQDYDEETFPYLLTPGLVHLYRWRIKPEQEFNQYRLAVVWKNFEIKKQIIAVNSFEDAKALQDNENLFVGWLTNWTTWNENEPLCNWVSTNWIS